jgi:chaperonin cofactor prefoldin
MAAPNPTLTLNWGEIIKWLREIGALILVAFVLVEGFPRLERALERFETKITRLEQAQEQLNITLQALTLELRALERKK